MRTDIQSTKQNQSAGFTLVEFIVIISIFAIVATVSLFNSGSFNRHTAMQNLTHDIALVIRQAQNYGMGSTSDDYDANIRYPVAVQFEYDNTNNRFLSQMILFRDLDNSGTFDPNNNDMLLDRITFRSPSYIYKIALSGQGCSDNVVVSFQRPLPDPTFFCGGATGLAPMVVTILNNEDQDPKTITIQPTGLISVD